MNRVVRIPETESEDRQQTGVQVIARAASVLRALENHPEGLSLGQLAKNVGLARSTVQRIVGALVAEDLLVSAGATGVRIGPGLARIAQSVQSNLAEVIRPQLRALGDEVGETVDLAILTGGSVTFIDQIQGSRRLIATSSVGESFPLHCTANGKAVLACFSDADARALIDRSLAEHPEACAPDIKRLMREIATTRRTHVAYDIEEHGAGISAAGIAMLDVFGRPVAVSIPAPSQRFAQEKAHITKKLLAFRERLKPLISR
jgi:DNA-binding IclR family transcriptional regulator